MLTLRNSWSHFKFDGICVQWFLEVFLIRGLHRIIASGGPEIPIIWFRFLQLLQWKMTYLKCSQFHISLKYFNNLLTVYVFLVNLCVSQCSVSLCQQRRSWRAFRQKNMNRDFKKWLLTWCWWCPGLCVCARVRVCVCGVKRVLLSHPVGSLKVFARRNTWQPSGACFSLWYPSHTNFDMQITHTHSLTGM